MAVFVSQAAVEVLVLPTSAAVRVSQAAVEVLVLPTSAAVRVSQAVVEVLVQELPAAGAMAPEVTAGPPMWAPWNQQQIFTVEDALPQISPIQPDPDPPSYAPPIEYGPGMGPWNPMQSPEEDSYLLGDPEPPPVGPEVQLPEIGYGPAIYGAPWLLRIPQQEFAWAYEEAVLPGTPGGEATPASRKQFVPRVPDLKDHRRLTRFTEQVSDIVNALVRRGQLSLEGINDWSIQNGNTDGGTW